MSSSFVRLSNIPSTRLQVDFVRGFKLFFDPTTLPHSPDKLRQIRDEFTSGNRRLIREHPRYDCFGLVLGNRKGVLPEATDTDIRTALDSDGFQRIADRTQLTAGDVVLYSRGRQIDHVGLVTGFYDTRISISELSRVRRDDIMILSKFGAAGAEYLHKIDDVPTIYGKPFEYWGLRNGA